MVEENTKILIVDDDKDIVETIDEILTNEGFVTCFSHDGKEALEEITKNKPDLVLLDCYLPEIMGIDVLKHIRKSNEDIPIIMMTGHGEEQLVVSLMKAGASDYLKKPIGKFTLLSAVKDVLRKRELSREMIQSERLLLLGELFPFVAHEIRNPLHAIGGALTIIQKRTSKDPIVDQSIKVINEEIYRLTNFVKECLDFSNPSDPSKFIDTDINDIITSSLDLLMPTLNDSPKKIDVTLTLQENLPKATTNFNEIKQVFLNVIKNSFEAINGEGYLEITTIYDPDYSSNHITIEFTDNGQGIKKEIAKKIFDPFFTTKTNSGGMGLGLSVCKKIICENHHGTLDINSVENEGTRLTIKLPLNQNLKTD